MLWSCLGLLLSSFSALQVYILISAPYLEIAHGSIENPKVQIAQIRILTSFHLISFFDLFCSFVDLALHIQPQTEESIPSQNLEPSKSCGYLCRD